MLIFKIEIRLNIQWGHDKYLNVAYYSLLVRQTHTNRKRNDIQ